MLSILIWAIFALKGGYFDIPRLGNLPLDSLFTPCFWLGPRLFHTSNQAQLLEQAELIKQWHVLDHSTLVEAINRKSHNFKPLARRLNSLEWAGVYPAPGHTRHHRVAFSYHLIHSHVTVAKSRRELLIKPDISGPVHQP
jgi:hypothetical protein